MNDTTQENGYDHDSQIVRVRDHGPGSLCITIVQIIAERAGVEPTDMEALHYRVDTGMIDRLCDGSREISGEVMFDYHGFRVTVTSDRQIVVAPITADAVGQENDRSANAE